MKAVKSLAAKTSYRLENGKCFRERITKWFSVSFTRERLIDTEGLRQPRFDYINEESGQPGNKTSALIH